MCKLFYHGYRTTWKVNKNIYSAYFKYRQRFLNEIFGKDYPVYTSNLSCTGF